MKPLTLDSPFKIQTTEAQAHGASIEPSLPAPPQKATKGLAARAPNAGTLGGPRRPHLFAGLGTRHSSGRCKILKLETVVHFCQDFWLSMV